jgi:hypothetical protein
MPRAKKVFDLGREHRPAPIAATDVVPSDLPADAVVELAWNGHRVLACAVGDDVRLVSPDFREWTDVCASERMGSRRSISFAGMRGASRNESLFACIDLQRVDGEDLRATASRSAT